MTWVVRAPAGELRGDEKKLYARVRRLLWDYEPLRASHAEIFIDVQGRDVRLRGRVRTLPQKIIAAALVRRLPDVDGVENALIADPEVVREVCDALARDERTAPYVLRVEARHGVVVLRGEVPAEAHQQAAVEVASGVPTVLSVRSAIELGGPAFAPSALPRPTQEADAAPRGLPAPTVAVPT